MDLVTFYRPIN